jgi:hypothetical protein
MLKKGSEKGVRSHSPGKGVRSQSLASLKECLFAVSSRQERLLTPFVFS